MFDKPQKPSSQLAELDEQTRYLTPIFGSEASDVAMPSAQMNDAPVEPRIAAEMIREYLSIEGNATQNSATFCQTYMEPTAVKLMADNLEKNAIDKDEYPMTADLENRCVAMIGNLWHANAAEQPIGTSTVGSSEACMLGGLGMLFRWKQQCAVRGVDYRTRRPNLVICSGYQVCWEKFCRYWDVDMRLVPLDRDHLSLNIDTVMDYVDTDTIGVVAILGITYTGRYDDVAALDAKLSAYNKQHPRACVRIHVDAASGGMFAPFVEPNLKWDFRLENVWSISTSGHKYGLVYPGVGWVVWRGKAALPEKLIFWVSYLGGKEATMAINFSRSASQIVGQYYMLMRNGRQGYREIHQRTLDVARYLAQQIGDMGCFDLFEAAEHLPIVCWTLKPGAGCANVGGCAAGTAAAGERGWTLYDLADRLRMQGWLVPAYPMPANLEHLDVQRLVVRQDFSMPLAIALVRDMRKQIDILNGQVAARTGKAFDHSGR